MMPSEQAIRQKLTAINGQDYGTYQALIGEYEYSGFRLIIEQIPKDPYAPPHTGIYRIQVLTRDQWLSNLQQKSKTREIAIRDFLARYFYAACQKISKGRRGTGNSGIITIEQPGQCILERSSVVLQDQLIEVRCFLGMPATGRIINSDIAIDMLIDELPRIVEQSLFNNNIDMDKLQEHIATSEDAEFLRNNLRTRSLVAFIANDAILPRESGSSDRPFPREKARPFISPDNLKVEFNLPNGGKIKGMGITEGVTLIVGGGYHGKSTLLQAIENGIYNHIPGDGREKCVTLTNAVKVRAYSGRYIEKTDISPFINHLPFDKDTTSFCTDNASGSTSQAAGIVESIEVGAQVLLMDEDACATNFMIRDKKMQQLISKEDEPITTYIDKVRQLYSDMNISTILVLGGVGDYFDVSDHVIQMIRYQPSNVTERAHKIVLGFPVKRKPEGDSKSFHISERIPVADSYSPLNEYGKRSVYAKEVNRLHFGKNDVDLTDLEQLVELSQTKALGFALEYAKKYMDDKFTMREIIEKVNEDIAKKGLDVLSNKISGNLAWFRGMELAFVLNRLPGLKVRQKRDN